MGNKLFISIILCGLVQTFPVRYIQENKPPKIKITAPEQNAKFSWNALVTYAISVSDFEDGNSEYDEIPTDEVILTIQYLPDSSRVKEYFDQDHDRNSEVLSWMGSSNCFTCHSAKDQLIGPSFRQIADRYQEREDAPEYLAKKILNGTTGTWGEEIMPANAELEIERIKETVGWIMKNSSDADFIYLPGTNGSFRTKKKPEEKAGNAVYVLKAHYTDQGIDGVSGSSKKSTATFVMQSE